jgi:integrase
MRGQFKVTFIAHRNKKYLVTGYVGPVEDRRRIRQFFRTKVEAETFTAQKNIELQNHGHELSVMPSALRAEAIACAGRLAPFGMTLTKVTDLWLGQNDWRSKSVLVKDAVPAYFAELDRKLAGSEYKYRTQETLRGHVKKLLPDLGELHVCDLTPQLLNRWLISQPVKVTTRNNIRRSLSVFFNKFAVPNEWITESPIPKTEKVDTKRLRKKPCIYTPEQAASILLQADQADHDLVPFFSLGLFAGLRTSEIERLEWNDIDFEERLIDVHITKTSKERWVPISDNLAAWLTPYRHLHGQVAPHRDEPRRKAVRSRAGIPEKGMANAARHSYCSYRYALNNDLGECAKHAGNSPAVFLSNYNHRVKLGPAERYFAIFPQDAQNILKVA